MWPPDRRSRRLVGSGRAGLLVPENNQIRRGASNRLGGRRRAIVVSSVDGDSRCVSGVYARRRPVPGFAARSRRAEAKWAASEQSGPCHLPWRASLQDIAETDRVRHALGLKATPQTGSRPGGRIGRESTYRLKNRQGGLANTLGRQFPFAETHLRIEPDSRPNDGSVWKQTLGPSTQDALKLALPTVKERNPWV